MNLVSSTSMLSPKRTYPPTCAGKSARSICTCACFSTKCTSSALPDRPPHRSAGTGGTGTSTCMHSLSTCAAKCGASCCQMWPATSGDTCCCSRNACASSMPRSATSEPPSCTNTRNVSRSCDGRGGAGASVFRHARPSTRSCEHGACARIN